MSDPFVFGGVVIGLVLLAAYVAKARAKSELADGISLILSGVGLLTGIKVCWISIADRDIPPVSGISTQVMIGGITLCWVSVSNVLKKFNN